MRIFNDDADYRFFLKLLAFYLTTDDLMARNLFHNRRWRSADHNLSGDVKLAGYCLMLNHFHLLIYQISDEGFTKLMRRVSASYSRYYNLRDDRTGHLFESYTQAVLIESDEQLMETGRYIHRNPAKTCKDLTIYPYSDLGQITKGFRTSWQDHDRFLNYFENNAAKYLEFVTDKS